MNWIESALRATQHQAQETYQDIRNAVTNTYQGICSGLSNTPPRLAQAVSRYRRVISTVAFALTPPPFRSPSVLHLTVLSRPKNLSRLGRLIRDNYGRPLSVPLFTRGKISHASQHFSTLLPSLLDYLGANPILISPAGTEHLNPAHR